MKKTKIIAGAFITIALFSTSVFAQQLTNSSKEVFLAIAGMTAGAKISKQLNDVKQNQEERGFLTLLNRNLFYLGDSFSPRGSAENFRILLPKGFEKTTFPEQEVWTTEGATFIVEEHFPYMSITVKSDKKNIEMSLAEVVTELDRKFFTQKELQEMEKNSANRKDISWETNGNKALLLTYKIGNKVYKKYLGEHHTIHSITSLQTLRAVEMPLNAVFKVKDNLRIDVRLPREYELVKSYWNTREYLSFKVNTFSSDLLHFDFYNNNPLEEYIPVKITETENKIYLTYTIKNTPHRELIATEK